jgi:hypothetical protein
VTVVLRHNDKLELNRVEYHGAVSLAELVALAEFQAANPTWLTYDTLSFVLPGAHFSAIDEDQLDTLFEAYRALFQPLNFLIMRRSAWLCQSAAARQHVLYWLRGRDTRESMSSDVRLFETFADAGDWLVLNADETDTLRSGAGFAEIVSYTIAPERAPAR